MTRNRLVSKLRGEHRQPEGMVEGWEPAAPGPSPAESVADRSLVQAIRARLSEREHHLLERRAEGRTWVELAKELGGSADALRMLHTRAVSRIRREFHEAI
jgi:DNA-directed RNA polymerase specialized sigma24 family protein